MESHRGAHEVGGRTLGGRAPHPREKGVGPMAFIFGVDFSLFLLRRSVKFWNVLKILGEESTKGATSQP